MPTARQKAIAELMTGLCNDRSFSGMEVAIIECQSNRIKYYRMKHKDEVYKATGEKGRYKLNQEIAAAVNLLISGSPVNADHIRLYKRCWADEFEGRTGKCPYGWKEIRIKYGYDPITGLPAE